MFIQREWCQMLKQLETNPGFELLDHFRLFQPTKKAMTHAIIIWITSFPLSAPKATNIWWFSMIFLGSFGTATQLSHARPGRPTGCGAQDYCQEGLEGYENFIAISVAWLWLIPMDPLAGSPGWIPKISMDSVWIPYGISYGLIYGLT